MRCLTAATAVSAILISTAAADSGPDAAACNDAARAHADRYAAPADLADAAIAGGLDGAVAGGLLGRHSGRDGWSERGATRGARVGGALAVLGAMNAFDPADWQRLYDEAHAACMAGKAPPPADCQSQATVSSGSNRGQVSVGSNGPCFESGVR